MTTSDFTYLIQNPQSLSEDQVQEIKTITSEFPYFQSARAIYLKGLKNNQSFKYNQELKTTAAYTTDRSILFDFITSDEFLQNQISQDIKENTEHLKNIDVKELEDISVNKSVTIDDNLSTQIEETNPILNPELFQPKTEISKVADFKPNNTKQPQEGILQFDTKNIEPLPEDILQIGKPLEFDKNERHSFNQWLKITAFKPIDRDSEQNESLSRKKKFELIDLFITKSPKINPAENTNLKIDIAKDRMIQPEALMTETLAQIYVEQKNYKKAIQSYKILSLKYPEKSGFFADRIKAIKILQAKNKEE